MWHLCELGGERTDTRSCGFCRSAKRSASSRPLKIGRTTEACATGQPDPPSFCTSAHERVGEQESAWCVGGRGAALTGNTPRVAPMNCPEWHEFWTVLASLQDRCPPALPVVIRTFRHPETVLGQCLRREKRFLVLLNRNLGEPQAIEVLCHEWAHALAWNCLLDRFSEMPGIDPVKFNRTSHDETWGCAYSQAWRAYLGGHLGEG